MPCQAAKAWLSSKGIPFTSKDVVEDDAAYDEMVRVSGQWGTPVIAVGDQAVVGFDRGKLQRVLGLV